MCLDLSFINSVTTTDRVLYIFFSHRLFFFDAGYCQVWTIIDEMCKNWSWPSKLFLCTQVCVSKISYWRLFFENKNLFFQFGECPLLQTFSEATRSYFVAKIRKNEFGIFEKKENIISLTYMYWGVIYRYFVIQACYTFPSYGRCSCRLKEI